MKVTVSELLETDGAFTSLLSRDGGVMLHLGVIDAQALNDKAIEPLTKKRATFIKAADEITKKHAEKDDKGNPIITDDPVNQTQSVKIANRPAFNAEMTAHNELFEAFLTGEVEMKVSPCIPTELLPEKINGILLRRVKPFLKPNPTLSTVAAAPKKVAKNG